jgi:flavodoxin
MTKTLVVFHSRSGYTRRVAMNLAAHLGADLDEVRIVEPMAGPLGYALCAMEAITGLAPAIRPMLHDPAAYDLVVVGSPVWFWSLSSPVRRWLEKYGRRPRQVAFFCTMGGSGAGRVFAAMRELVRVDPIGTLSMTDSEVDAHRRPKLDAFIRELRVPHRGHEVPVHVVPAGA